VRRRQRVLGRAEIERLLAACPPPGRLMVATALFSGLRISEMLGLTWNDIDFVRGVIHVRLQLSRARREMPASRVPTKTAPRCARFPSLPSWRICSLRTSRRRPSRRTPTGSLPPPVALPTDTAMSFGGCSNALLARLGSTKKAGRHCDFMICAITRTAGLCALPGCLGWLGRCRW